MNQNKLDNIITQHKLWVVTGNEEGIRADLRGANLTGAYLHAVDLRGADLRGADLTAADLTAADFHAANLTGANLTGADLRGANLHAANLTSANLHAANLTAANLTSLKGKPITTFQYNKHVAYSCDGRIKVGCEDHTIEYWVSNFKEIGIDNEYTPDEIKKYGDFIKYINTQEI